MWKRLGMNSASWAVLKYDLMVKKNHGTRFAPSLYLCIFTDPFFKREALDAILNLSAVRQAEVLY